MDTFIGRWRITAAVLLAAALAAAPATLRAQDDSNAHMLWSISSEAGVEGYLVGSIHIMKPDVYPLDAVFQEAFAESDVFVFELNLDSVQAKGTQFVSAGTLEEGKTLKSMLSPETYALILETVKKLGLPESSVQGMEPWLVSIMLPAVQYTRAGYAGTSGIDMHFFNRAKEEGKDRLALETVEFQIQLFDGMPADLQEKVLRHSLEQADRTVAMIDEMMRHWMTGDTAALAAQMKEEWQSFPEFYDALVAKRNQNWLPEIEELLNDDPVPMIIVGAGHIIGEAGLVSLLEARGYTVSQR